MGFEDLEATQTLEHGLLGFHKPDITYLAFMAWAQGTYLHSTTSSWSWLAGLNF